MLEPTTGGRCLHSRRAPADRTLLTLLALLLMAGLVALFSATYYKALDHGDALLEVKRQLIGIGLGGVLMLVTKGNCAIHDLMAGTVVVDYNSQKIFNSPDELIEYQKEIAAEQARRQSY